MAMTATLIEEPGDCDGIWVLASSVQGAEGRREVALSVLARHEEGLTSSMTCFPSRLTTSASPDSKKLYNIGEPSDLNSWMIEDVANVPA